MNEKEKVAKEWFFILITMHARPIPEWEEGPFKPVGWFDGGLCVFDTVEEATRFALANGEAKRMGFEIHSTLTGRVE